MIIDYLGDNLDSDILTWTFTDLGNGYTLTCDHKIIKNKHLLNLRFTEE